MQQEQSQEQQPLHPNCTFVCITEDVNNGSMAITPRPSNFTQLESAMERITENRSRGHYSCNNFDKIIVIDSNGEIEQVYTRQPEDYGTWRSQY